MKVGIISFTDRGSRLCARLCALLGQRGYPCLGYVPGRYFTEDMARRGIKSLEGKKAASWAGEMFEEKCSMVFVGAAGIAVRAVAPWLKDKFQDPAVVVVDEAGRFAVSLLSGHVGGANELAGEIAGLLGAAAVVTTATDINGVFAVDVFAAKNGLRILDRQAARAVAMDLLEGRPVGFLSDFPVRSAGKDWLPAGMEGRERQRNVRITLRRGDWQKGDLVLVPRALVLGVGCKRGICAGTVKRRVELALREAGLYEEAVAALATIDRKKEEPGLLELSREKGWGFLAYCAGELKGISGEFSGSDFVHKTVGVDNVCERAAVAGSGGGPLILRKFAGEGVTVAAAVKKLELRAAGDGCIQI